MGLRSASVWKSAPQKGIEQKEKEGAYHKQEHWNTLLARPNRRRARSNEPTAFRVCPNLQTCINQLDDGKLHLFHSRSDSTSIGLLVLQTIWTYIFQVIPRHNTFTISVRNHSHAHTHKQTRNSIQNYSQTNNHNNNKQTTKHGVPNRNISWRCSHGDRQCSTEQRNITNAPSSVPLLGTTPQSKLSCFRCCYFIKSSAQTGTHHMLNCQLHTSTHICRYRYRYSSVVFFVIIIWSGLCCVWCGVFLGGGAAVLLLYCTAAGWAEPSRTWPDSTIYIHRANKPSTTNEPTA